jgi:urea transport system substrate-binding protein
MKKTLKTGFVVWRLLLLVGVMLAVLIVAWYWVVQPIRCLPNCIGANLIGVDLSHLDLHDAHLVEANLREANLNGVNFHNANLSGAILARASLEDSDLRNAKLLGADLTAANLSGARLEGADLSGADLTSANLSGLDLTQVNLSGVDLDKAILIHIVVSHTHLAGAEIAEAQLKGAQLISVDLSGAHLSKSDLSGAELTDSNLSGALLNLANLNGAQLANSDLSGASLIGANLSSANLRGAKLNGAALVGVNFKGTNLRSADLTAAKLTAEELSDADLKLDPVLMGLNELGRKQILINTDVTTVDANERTIWPSQDITQQVEELQNADVAAARPVITDSIKVGILNSLSGPLALSEVAVRDGALLAIQEINAAGGVLGKPLEVSVEDGASNWPNFADKARKLIEHDKVAVIFGCWTSASRKAVRPVLEELNSLLFYPAQYEGLESSPNIFYMGAEASQQIVPTVEYLLVNQDRKKFFLLGNDSEMAHTTSSIIKARLAYSQTTVAGEAYVALDQTNFAPILDQIKLANPDVIINTMTGASNIAFFRQAKAAGLTPTSLPIISTNIAEEEIRHIGAENVVGNWVAGNYFQTTNTQENVKFVEAYKQAYGTDRVTGDTIEAAYTSVYLWKAMVEQAKSTAVNDIRKTVAARIIEYQAPEGMVRIDAKTQHTYKTLRIGAIRDDGLIEEIFASPAPIKPDPFLTQYEWAKGLKVTTTK